MTWIFGDGNDGNLVLLQDARRLQTGDAVKTDDNGIGRSLPALR
jgi:hypothetical protein